MGRVIPASQSVRLPHMQAGHALVRPYSYRAGALPAWTPSTESRLAEGEADAAQEDAYWREAFVHEPYYVSGRGYDQYQPAYALGWKAAHAGAAPFADIAAELELRWESQDSSSYLPWDQVRPAVQAAWRRGRRHAQQGQAAQADAQALLQPLFQACQGMADALQRVPALQAATPPQDFVTQVVQRHLELLRSLTSEMLSAGLLPQARPAAAWRHWFGHWQRRWSSWKLDVQDVQGQPLLAWCVEREQQLLAAYARALAQPLPAGWTYLLEQQRHRLEGHVRRAQWVLQHWRA